MSKPITIYSILYPMYYTTKILGLTPFGIDSKNYKKTNRDLFWSISLMLFLSVYGITGVQTSGIDSEIIAEVTAMLDALLGHAGMCCGILFGCIFRDDILTSLQEITIFDKEMQICLHVNVKQECLKDKRKAIFGLIITIIFGSVVFGFAVYGTEYLLTFELFGELINYSAPYLLNTFVDLHICTLLFCLKQRFGWLNKKIIEISRKLKNNLQECDGIFLCDAQKKSTRAVTHAVAAGFIQDKALYFIEKIRANHYRLCTITKTLNKAYSVQMLIIVMQSFITIIVSLYYSGKYIFIDNHVTVQYLVYAGVQLSSSFGLLLALVYFCSITTNEAKKTGILIHKLTSFRGKEEMKCKEELRLEVTFFSLQLLHHNVQITACKIFVINESLIFSIVGAITTYMIIVTQFEAGNIK